MIVVDTNVLATCTQHGLLDLAEASRLWQQADRRLRPAERPVSMAAALRLATESRISAYDAQYVTLALQLRVTCVTEDHSLLRAFPGVAVSMLGFCGCGSAVPGGRHRPVYYIAGCPSPAGAVPAAVLV